MTEPDIFIDIPEKVEYTKALFCVIDPPQSNMSISFTEEGSDKPFRTGYIKSRRGPEIAAFMFRPKKFNRATKTIEKHLVPPCKVSVTVNIHEGSEDKDPTKLGKVIIKKTTLVSVTAKPKPKPAPEET